MQAGSRLGDWRSFVEGSALLLEVRARRGAQSSSTKTQASGSSSKGDSVSISTPAQCATDALSA